MESDKTVITVTTKVNAPVETVWQVWTSPEHIVQWNNASEDWHTPKAENDLQVGGAFVYTMAARDGSMSFDFGGVYDEVVPHEVIAYTIADGRKVWIEFAEVEGQTLVKESFEAESTHSVEMQQAGWQAILDNFKNYVENN